MGRPIHKKYFGAESGNQLKVEAKLAGQVEGTGYIVSQRGTRKYRVSIAEVEGVCTLVNKDSGTLADGEMIINVVDDSGTTVQVTKLQARTAQVEGNQKVKWGFDPSVTDGAVQATDATSIDISTQPSNYTTVLGVAQFAITAVGATTYQWQVRQGSGSYSDIVDGDVDGLGAGTLTYAGTSTAILDITGSTVLEDKWKYRVVMTAPGADSKTSSAGTLTFGD